MTIAPVRNDAHPAPVLDAFLWEALRKVVDPCSIATGVPINIVDMGLVTDVSLDDGHATVTLILTSPVCMQVSNICEQIDLKLTALPTVDSTEVVVDRSDIWDPGMMDEGARSLLRGLRSTDARRDSC